MPWTDAGTAYLDKIVDVKFCLPPPVRWHVEQLLARIAPDDAACNADVQAHLSTSCSAKTLEAETIVTFHKETFQSQLILDRLSFSTTDLQASGAGEWEGGEAWDRDEYKLFHELFVRLDDQCIEKAQRVYNTICLVMHVAAGRPQSLENPNPVLRHEDWRHSFRFKLIKWLLLAEYYPVRRQDMIGTCRMVHAPRQSK